MTAQPESSEPSSEQEEADAKQAKALQRSRRLGTLIFYVTRTIFHTLRITYVNKTALDPKGKGVIYVTWHGLSLIPANEFAGKKYWALISLSRDGELQNHIFHRLGFHTIRGSTGRGGVKGALQMARKVKEGGVLAFTPDGPRGPTHKCQLGVIMMAEKSGAPIIPMGLSSRWRILVKSWDSYMVPLPCSRAYYVLGEPFYVPAGLDDAGRRAYAVQLETLINRVEKQAEEMAGRKDYPAEWQTEEEAKT
ncbi:MAG: lysophospholipid acyltransferase family protein [Armatimonadetes bacterium]|nr:lysophospholipid acyltransferase family protein [Armatimonadota bacterium]